MNAMLPLTLVVVGLLFIACSTEPSSQPPEPGDARSPEPREISVALEVPDAGWSIGIEGVYRVGDELWAVSRLTRSGGMAAQVISTVQDSARVRAPAGLPVRHFVIGKTWNWENDVPYTFIESREEITQELRGAEKLYPSEGGGGGELGVLRPLNQEYIPMH